MTFFDNILLHHLPAIVTRHEQDTEVRFELSKLIGQGWARHSRGNHIREQQVDGLGLFSEQFYGLLSGEPEEQAVRLGWAHGALLTTFPGDTTMATAEQVRALAKGGSARIQR